MIYCSKQLFISALCHDVMTWIQRRDVMMMFFLFSCRQFDLLIKFFSASCLGRHRFFGRFHSRSAGETWFNTIKTCGKRQCYDLAIKLFGDFGKLGWFKYLSSIRCILQTNCATLVTSTNCKITKK